MENAVIVSGNDLQTMIKEAVRSELMRVSRTTIPTPPEPQEGNIDFAQKVLRVYARSTIYRMTSQGILPHKKRGRTLWFNRADLEKWLNDGATNQR